MNSPVLIGIVIFIFLVGIAIYIIYQEELKKRRIVRMLKDCGPLSFDEISRNLGMGYLVSNPWLNKALKSLEKRGVVEKLGKNNYRWSIK